MKIGFYEWQNTDADTKARIMHRAEADIDALSSQVQPILENVRANGEAP